MAKVVFVSEGVYRFMCPGCKEWHTFWCNGIKHHNGATWNFDMNMDSPTITPSLNISWGKVLDPNWVEPDDVEDVKSHFWSGRCHSIITAGKISFCGDCTHDLVGKTVDLPDID